MDMGMIGLGRMGANMAQRLVRGGHRVVGFDIDPAARAAAAGDGIEPATSLEALVQALPAPREGRWTVAEAIDLDVSAPVITLSLLQRLRSREPESFADKLLSALRNQFGGHAVKR
jgi:6-phosphogluconate dehydrogenase (decarboxylating)